MVIHKMQQKCFPSRSSANERERESRWNRNVATDYLNEIWLANWGEKRL